MQTSKFAAKKVSPDAWERTDNSEGQKKGEKEATRLERERGERENESTDCRKRGNKEGKQERERKARDERRGEERKREEERK